MIAVLAIWLAASVIATVLVARLFNVSAQSDDHTTDDLADADRLVLFAEMTPTFHAAPNSHKEQPDHGA